MTVTVILNNGKKEPLGVGFLRSRLIEGLSFSSENALQKFLDTVIGSLEAMCGNRRDDLVSEKEVDEMLRYWYSHSEK